VVVRTSSGRLNAIVQLSDHSFKQPALPMGVTILPAKNAWRELRR
jgi:phosphotransferase system IIA component